MDREIKFRGKCAPSSKYAGEWVEGGLVVPEVIKDNEILIITAHSDTCTSTCHVDANTVCEFTGLYDKNEKKVYENDLVFVNGQIYKVVYFKGMFAIKIKGCGYVPLKNFIIEVIGNIYDNKEVSED